MALALLLLAGVSPGPARARTAQARGCDDASYHQFDFWIGDWDSYDKGGGLLGHTLVQKALDGCAIQEWWLGANGEVSSSLTMYDRSRGVWHRTWASNRDFLLSIEGNLAGRSLILIGPSRSDGAIQLHRTTWTPLPAGRVHQLWDFSEDGGHSWKVNYDGYLRPAAHPFDKAVAYHGLSKDLEY